MEMVETKPKDQQLVEKFANDLKNSKFAFANGKMVGRSLNISDAEVKKLARYWNELTLDEYMGDGGRYRYRRYSALNVCSDISSYVVQPHHPYVQPKKINPLNGDVKREFDPIDPNMLNEPAFQKVMQLLLSSCDAVENEAKPKPWVVRLHPYRIHANNELEGKPSPEGLHRDGVDYVTSVLIKRHNVLGGESIVANADKVTLHRKRLTNPLDILTCDDEAVLHDVSHIAQLDPKKPGWRDVLVVAFSRD